jgi:hypothetical protein
LICNLIFNIFSIGLDSLLNPKDYQNVPAAVKLLKVFALEPITNFVETNPLENDISNEFKLLSFISKLVLSFFIDPNTNLSDQLVDLATLAHVLLFVYRRQQTKFMTNNLYCDIQSTIQDSFIAAAKFKLYTPLVDLLIILLGEF